MNIYTVDECVLCLDAPSTIVFAPCGHLCSCAECSALVCAAAMECPLCRQVISQVLVHVLDEDVVAPAKAEEVLAFKRERRTEYVASIGRPAHTNNAAFKGKSKFARSVSAAIGNELEKRRKENTGSERACVPSKKVTFARVEDTLTVTWQVGRKKHNESHPYMELSEAIADIHAGMGEGDDAFISTLDLATWWPEYYWVIRFHAGSVETALQEADLLSGKRRK